MLVPFYTCFRTPSFTRM